MHPCYVALGDSMSIDLYPQLDLQGSGRIGKGAAAAVGAASLFYRNDDEVWPEFEGEDLRSREPSLEKLDLCVDGATIPHTRDFQLPKVPDDVRAATSVVTVTAGGNDLLGGLFDGMSGLEQATRDAVRRYEDLAERVVAALPSATILLTTVYDPTDGTGDLPNIPAGMGPLPMELLDVFNEAVARVADEHDRARLADVHGHFLGHGLSAPEGERWYWETSPIEPGARGASEIRRVWLRSIVAPDRAYVASEE